MQAGSSRLQHRALVKGTCLAFAAADTLPTSLPRAAKRLHGGQRTPSGGPLVRIVRMAQRRLRDASYLRHHRLTRHREPPLRRGDPGTAGMCWRFLDCVVAALLAMTVDGSAIIAAGIRIFGI